jgi:hypothetical protein
MDYSLEKDGDKYEVRYWPILRNDFQNYETFWAKFIVPMTMRADGHGIGLKKEIDPLLESIAMAHYSVFYHLGGAAELYKSLDQEFAEDVLFHLSSATEMVERLIFTLANLESTLLGTGSISTLTDKEVSTLATEYALSKQYAKDFGRFKTRGQAVNIHLHNIDDVTKPFMQRISEQAAKDFENWQATAKQIRHYRNTLAHNPRLGILLDDGEKVYVPKEPILHKYELWSGAGKRNDNGDFVLLNDLISGFQKSLVEKTNSAWTCLITFMDRASKTKGYDRLLGVASTMIILDDPQPAEPIFPPPSGSYPRDSHESSVD